MNAFGFTSFRSPVYRIAIIALPLIFLSQCRISKDPGAGADPADYLPIDNDISGFVKKGSVSTMTDEQSIYAAIDGAAQTYITYGFQEGVVQLYSNGSIDINVAIFNQGTEQNALDLFNFFYPTSPDLISTKNPIVVVDLSQATSYTIQYAKQSIFLRISTTEKSDFALNMAKQFYWNIDKKIGVE
ncbi:MAG TPA: hypothetical protein VLX68_06320 [Chitinivibrionales bacterium]|nr:hypothetical protein [Chitinivibrionales bacterium]